MKAILLIFLLLVLAGGVFLVTHNRNENYDNEYGTEATSSVPSPATTAAPKISTTSPPVPANTRATENAAVTFDVDAFNFGYSKKTLEVKKGDTVTINLTSTGGTHDWRVDAFNAKTNMVKDGGKDSVTFVADKAGTYEYYCSVGNHRAMGMVGQLVVRE